MNNKELFDKTVSILVKAYQIGTLEYMDCARCAVGNLVKAHCGDDEWSGGWSCVIELGQGVLTDNFKKYPAVIKKLQSTGYSVQHLAAIEKAFFEGTGSGFSLLSKDDENFNGLMAVVDTLMEIHEATPEQVTKAKQLFVKC